MWLRKLLLFLETKNLKKPKIWTFGFLGFLKNLKNLGFLKATSTALGVIPFEFMDKVHFTGRKPESLAYPTVKTASS